MKFMADIRPTIATGNKSATDVVKEVAALWRTIDSNKKQKYTDAYEKDQVINYSSFSFIFMNLKMISNYFLTFIGHLQCSVSGVQK